MAFQDLWHAEWALWQLGTDAEAIAPDELRARLLDRAAMLAARYAPGSLEPPQHPDAARQANAFGCVDR